MGITHRRIGGIPTTVIDEKATAQIALVAQGVIQARAFDQGRGLDDKRHKAYSPSYAKTRTKKGLQVSPPNLTRSGNMRRKFRVIRVSKSRATLALTGDAAIYGKYVNDARPFIGASPKDRIRIQRVMPKIVLAAIRRAARS